MQLLAIKDNRPGHYNQTEGLILSLKEIHPHITIEYLDVQITNSLCRKILKMLLNTFPSFFEKPLSLKLAKLFYKTPITPQNTPDLIISTGGNTAGLNAWLRKIYHCKNILNGKLRGLNENHFTAVTTVIDLGYSNQIILDVAPSIITALLLQEKSHLFCKQHAIPEHNEYYTLLIGGNGAGYTYNDSFYDHIIGFVKHITHEINIKWLISTSRRTPIDVESRLHDALEAESIYFVAFHHSPEQVLTPFLGLAKRIFVTEESSSMISEAIAANKEVFTLGIDTNKADENYRTILKKFEYEGKIKRIDIMQENPSLACHFHLSQTDYYKKTGFLLKQFI